MHISSEAGPPSVIDSWLLATFFILCFFRQLCTWLWWILVIFTPNTLLSLLSFPKRRPSVLLFVKVPFMCMGKGPWTWAASQWPEKSGTPFPRGNLLLVVVGSFPLLWGREYWCPVSCHSCAVTERLQQWLHSVLQPFCSVPTLPQCSLSLRSVK